MASPRRLSLCMFLSLAGLAVAGYLAYLHLGLIRGEFLAAPGCSPDGGTFNCHAVTASPWGQFLGMPIALWGALGYLAVYALALWGRQSAENNDHAAVLIFLLAAVSFAIDLYLLYIMATQLQHFCTLCLATHLINLGLLVTSAIALPVPWPQALGRAGAALAATFPSSTRPAGGLLWGLLMVSALGVFSLHASVNFVSRTSSAENRKQIREFLVKAPRMTMLMAEDPTHGPSGAPVQMVEFSDFMCPACQRASKMNTIILAGHRKDVQLVFKHYPLDTACNTKISRNVHPGACHLAAASECAHLQGKFWPIHDRIFEKGHAYTARDLESDLPAAGVDMAAYKACMDAGQGMAAVKKDIEEGAKIGINSTPTYVINGSPVGGLTPALFEDFIAVLKDAR